jgi:hypothetical protein
MRGEREFLFIIISFALFLCYAKWACTCNCSHLDAMGAYAGRASEQEAIGDGGMFSRRCFQFSYPALMHSHFPCSGELHRPRPGMHQSPVSYRTQAVQFTCKCGSVAKRQHLHLLATSAGRFPNHVWITSRGLGQHSTLPVAPCANPSQPVVFCHLHATRWSSWSISFGQFGKRSKPRRPAPTGV